MGYSNVAGDLNVFSSTSTNTLVVRSDTTLNGNLTATAGFHSFGNVTTGNLTVTGNFTVTATNTQVTNALSINNAGTSTALKVVQYEGGGPGHTYNVAEFWDFTTLAMVIDPEGNVGIHTTSSPGYSLTVGDGSYLTTVTSQLYMGNGSGLSNLTTSNLNGLILAPQLANTQTNITTVGTLTNLNVNDGSNLVTVTALLYLGNASGLSNLNSSNLVGNVANSNVALVVSQASQPNITSVGTLTGLNVSGTSNLSTTNVTTLNASSLRASSLNVTGTSNLSTVTGSLYIGNASGLSNLNSSNLVGNVANANVALVVSQPAQPNITSLGILTGLNVSGTSNLSTTIVASLNVTGTSNLSTLTSLLYIGNASGLSNLNSSNLVGNVANANVALVVSQPAQPNITSVGILTALNVSGTSNLSTTNVTTLNAASVLGRTLNVTGTSNLTITNAASLTVSTIANISSLNVYSDGTALMMYVASFFGTNSNITGTSNLSTTNVTTLNASSLSASSLNVTGTSNLSAVTALLYIGNASGLSNLNSSNLVGNVANANVALVVSQPAQPNITSVGTLIALNVSGTSNLLDTNVTTLNASAVFGTSLNVTGTSNLSIITGFLYIGNASGLSNLNSSNLVGNVANANVALVVSQPAQPNITSLGILTGLNVSGTSNLSTTNVTTLNAASIFGTNLNVTSASNLATANVTTLNTSVTSVTSSLNVTGTSNLSTTNVTSLNTSVTSVTSSLNVTGTSNLSTTNVTTLNVATANVTNLTVRTLANIYDANVTNTVFTNNIYAAGFTSNTTNTVFNFDTLTIPFITSTTLNVSSTSNLSTTNVTTLNTSSLSASSLNVTGTSNLSTANITTLNAASIFGTNLNVTGTSNLSTANITTLNAASVLGGTLNVTGTSNLSTTNVLTLNTATANVTNLTVRTQANVVSANIVTANVGTLNVATPIPISSGLFMNLNATYTLNATGNWTGNIAGSITSNLFTLFAPNPVASWTTYGANPVITGPTANGGFRFSQTGPYQFNIVLTSDNNIKTIALSSNTSDVHSNLADPGVWLYCYRISVGQDPSVPVQIPFYVDSTSKYYYIDFEAMNTSDNIHRTAYTNVTAEGYTGSYVTLRPV